jgi:hypothetical protein
MDASSRTASAVADASGVHPSGVIPLKIRAESFASNCPANSAVGARSAESIDASDIGCDAAASSNIYEGARESLARIVGRIAERKNVPVLPEAHDAIAERAVEFMDLPVIYDFMALRNSGIMAATRALNRSLDVYFAISLYAFIGQLDGREDFTPEAIESLGEQFVETLLPPDTPFYRWPDLTEMVARHYAARNAAQPGFNRRKRRGMKGHERKRRGAMTGEAQDA